MRENSGLTVRAKAAKRNGVGALVGVGGGGLRRAWHDGVANAGLEAIEIEIDDRSGEERKELAENQASDNSDAEGAAQFGADTCAKSERERSEEGGHGGH